MPTSNRASPTLDSEDKESRELEATQLPVLESQTAPGGVPIQTPAMKRKALWQFATLCLSIYVSGWNDGTLGPLLPRLQTVYNVRIFTRRGMRSRICY